MNRESLSASSEAVTGNVPRTVPYNERIHQTDHVGEPQYEPAYRPDAKKPDNKSDGGSDQLLMCILILVSPDLYKVDEYRIGRFKNKQDLSKGLTAGDPKKKTFVQNPDVLRRTFGSSQIYRSRAEAIKAAEDTWPSNTGIKMLWLKRRYPFSEQVLNVEA